MATSAAYTKGSVFRHISSLSVTSAIGLFAIFIVDLVDVFFIALLGEPELAAAVGFAGTALFFGAAMCIGLAIATSTVVAQAIGAESIEKTTPAADDSAEKQTPGEGESVGKQTLAAGKSVEKKSSTEHDSLENPPIANGESFQKETLIPDSSRLATHGLLMGACITIPAAVLSFIYAPELLSLIGAKDETLALAVDYFRIVVCSLPILGLAMAGTSLLRAVGDGQRSMWATIIAGIVNAVLDPILIFGFSLDLKGAAIASVLSRITVAACALYFIQSRHQLIKRPRWSLFFSDLRRLAEIAIPSLITNLAGPFGAAYATSQMAKFGTDAVAAAAVIGRLTPVAFAGIYGLSGAVGPVASQNIGAQNWPRVTDTLKAAGWFVTLYVVPVAIAIFLLQDVLVSVFDLEGEAAELLRFYCTFIVSSYWLFGLQLAANPMFTALRHPGYATISNIGRDLLFGIPLVFIGSHLFLAPGVIAGQALGNMIAGVIAYSIAMWLCKRVENGQSIDLPIRAIKQRWHFHRAVVPGVQHRGH